MKVAIIVHGQPRFTPYFFDFLNNKLDTALSHDWYFYLWNQTNKDDNRIPEWWTSAKDNKVVTSLLNKNQNITYFTCNDLPEYNQEFETFQNKRTETVPKNVWYMLLSLYMAGLAVEKHQSQKNYDLVIKIRTDMTSDEPIPLQQCLDFIKKSPNNIITSHWHTWGYHTKQINDWFAIGNFGCMNIYTKLWPNLIKYCRAGLLLHPESLLASHLILNDLDWVYSNITVRLSDKIVNYFC